MITTGQTQLLLEALGRGTLALFFGGDLPRDVTGMPSRADLAHALAQRHTLDDNASLARVAQQVGRGGYRREFTVFLREQLQGASPQLFHQRLVAFVREHGIKTLITTAYDDLLRRAFDEAGVPVEVAWKDSQLSVAFQDRPLLIQLYGNPLSDVESLIITEDDHLGLWRDRSRENVLDEVKRALQRHTVLFLGYDLSDPDFLLLWREILSRAGDLHRRAFAVWPGLPEAEVGVWADRGIVILEEEPWGLVSGAMLSVPDASTNTIITPAAPVTTRFDEIIQLKLETWQYHAGASVAQVAVSAAGDYILAGTLGKQVICLDQEGQRRWSADVGNQAWRVVLSANGETAVVGTGSTRPWDMKGRGIYVFDRQGRLRWQDDLKASVWGLAVAADGHSIAVGTDGHEVLIYNDEGHLLWRRKIPGLGWAAWVWATALSASGETIVLGAADKTVQILDRGGNLLGVHKAEADVFTVAVSADGQTIAAGSSDRQVYLLDRQGTLLWSEKFKDKIWDVILTARGERLVVGAGEKESHVRVFDRAGQHLWQRYIGGGVSCVSLDSEGDILSVGTDDGHIYLFDREGEPMHNAAATKKIRSVAVAGGGQVATAGSEDGTIYGILLPSHTSSSQSKGSVASLAPQSAYHGIAKAWAILVGINRYDDPYIANLKVCMDDVTAIRQALAGHYQAARLLTDATPDHLPTRANILGELSTVAQTADADDLLLFYFSGHGMAKGGESYLLARDTRLSALKHTAVAMQDVREIIEQSPAHAKVIVLDACHSGASTGKAEPTMTPEFIQRVFEEAEGMAVLASCKQGQQSWEWQAERRSVFTYYLLEALSGKADLDGKGFVTVSDASRHVTDGVKAWAVNQGVPQTPTLQYTVAGDIILVRYESEGASS